MVRVPGRVACSLGPHGHQQFKRHAHKTRPPPLGGHDERPCDPDGLHGGEPDGVTQAGAVALGVFTRGAQPHRHQPQAHDGEASRGDLQRHHIIFLCDARSDQQHANDLHGGGQPKANVVGVVGAAEPRKVHPRPPDAKERQQKLCGRQCVVLRHDAVVQLGRRCGHGHHGGQIKQRLQRRGGAVRFMDVAPTHATAQSQCRW